ncbi:hypothetical protein NHX12_010525 [Muraenolepis orangiensis]|uniref:FCH and double SH3 domains 2 n=1 Tax=Muraenolepis orangiensis TaxID=630683 RepID=A0A9Q0DNB5_9TELE|nr:hypothetical protein NHX12_010525 [Muraenolepis orangiensis]
MQPPPRKTHAEQLSRLQVKHQTECELLEDLRTFSQKKAAVDRDYAQALQKLANQYLKKEWPGLPADEQTNHSSMYCVWRAYLEGTVQFSQSRVSACDIYKVQVAEPAKAARLQKDLELRKCVEQLTEVQAELQESVKDLTKSRKKYQETEVLALAVREKAELEAKSKLSLFQSRSSLQRASVKLKAKRSECNSKASHARNDYLLSLAAANVLDGRIHEQVKDYLVSMCQTELDTYQVVHTTFNQLLDSSKEVLQDFHQQLFVQRNPTFHKAPDFLFQPSDSDTVGPLCYRPSPGRALVGLLAVTRSPGYAGEVQRGDVVPRFRGGSTAQFLLFRFLLFRALEEYGSQEGSEQNHSELETKVEAARQNLRRAETVKVKAEARLDLLRQAGVVVETWLKSAMNQVMEELENERWANLGPHDPSLSGQADFDGEALDDSSSSPSSTLRNYPLTCKVLYSYKSCQPDELTIEEQEMLEVIDDGDMDDWVKARNRGGQVGYVPEKYLQLPSSNSLLSMLQSLAALDARSHSSMSFAKALYDYVGQTEDELSFPEGGVIRILSRETREDDGFWEGEFNGMVGVFPAVLAPSSPLVSTPAPSDQSPQSPFQPGAFHSSPCQSSPVQTPTSLASPLSSPSSTAASSPVGRPPSYSNGHHRVPPVPLKSPSASSAQPPIYPVNASGTIRPVRAAPPPPKQHPRGQVKRREEVEITLV